IRRSSYRFVHGHEFGAVGKGRLDLDFVDHLGDAVHDLAARDHMRALLHQLGDRAPVARPFEDEIRDQRHRLRMVELDAAFEPAPRHHGGHGDQQLVLFARGEIHARLVQWTQQCGSLPPRNVATSAMRSCRKAAPSAAHSRATAIPFQAEVPTSPRNREASARSGSIVSAPPGTISTVAMPAPPLATPASWSFSAMGPSSRTLSAKTSTPPRRIRHRSNRNPCLTASPMPVRPNTTPWGNTRGAAAPQQLGC